MNQQIFSRVERRPLDKELLQFLADRRPGVHRIVCAHEVEAVVVQESTRRSRLSFIGLVMPRNPKDPDWQQFGRQVDNFLVPCIVIDGTLANAMTCVVHRGRKPLRPPVAVGDSFWIDPMLLHSPAFLNPVTDDADGVWCRDMGVHQGEREAKVTIVNREAYLIEIAFDDGLTFRFDIDEIVMFGVAWVDK